MSHSQQNLVKIDDDTMMESQPSTSGQAPSNDCCGPHDLMVKWHKALKSASEAQRLLQEVMDALASGMQTHKGKFKKQKKEKRLKKDKKCKKSKNKKKKNHLDKNDECCQPQLESPMYEGGKNAATSNASSSSSSSSTSSSSSSDSSDHEHDCPCSGPSHHGHLHHGGCHHHHHGGRSHSHGHNRRRSRSRSRDGSHGQTSGPYHGHLPSEAGGSSTRTIEETLPAVLKF
ncbi:uncharacterized protein LOC142229811 [Haematobia irritans]|uniref:Putative vitellogenin-like protein n=1 Tax=Haematobia irritans TaxID=7368 RepID=A0A1L8ECL0_HAEIR